MKQQVREDVFQVREDVANQISNLIESGLLQMNAIDIDGRFCYVLTNKGYKIAKEIETSIERIRR